jgi:hypothetical protein
MHPRLAVAWSMGVALAVASAPRVAAACSCERSMLLSPTPGATDVPINAVIVFEVAPAPIVFSIVVYDVTHDVEVPTAIEPFGNIPQTWLVRPAAPLAPNSIFEVRPVPYPSSTMSRFMTGASTDDAAPTYDGFTSLGPETVDTRNPPCRSSCWVGDTFRRLRFGYAEPPVDTALLLMEVERVAADGTPTVATVPLFRGFIQSVWPERIQNGDCIFGVPAFATDENVCARMVAFDMAGHRSAPSREICSRAVACAPRFDNTCTPVDECLPGSDPSTPDAGPDDAESDDGDAGAPPPTDDPDADAAPTDPSTPDAGPDDAESDDGDPSTPDAGADGAGSDDGDPSTPDAGADGAGSNGGDAGAPPRADPDADVGAPLVPTDENESGVGCSLSRGSAVRASTPARLFVMAIAGALLWHRRRRAPIASNLLGR